MDTLPECRFSTTRRPHWTALLAARAAPSATGGSESRLGRAEEKTFDGRQESNSATNQGRDRGSSHDSYHGGLSLARRDRPLWGLRPSPGRRPVAPFF